MICSIIMIMVCILQCEGWIHKEIKCLKDDNLEWGPIVTNLL